MNNGVNFWSGDGGGVRGFRNSGEMVVFAGGVKYMPFLFITKITKIFFGFLGGVHGVTFTSTTHPHY